MSSALTLTAVILASDGKGGTIVRTKTLLVSDEVRTQVDTILNVLEVPSDVAGDLRSAEFGIEIPLKYFLNIDIFSQDHFNGVEIGEALYEKMFQAIKEFEDLSERYSDIRVIASID